MRPVETRYAKSGETRIAYQVIGQGSLDLMLVPGFISNLDVLWEDPGFGRLVRRLTTFSRLILFDKRGTGLSDRLDAGSLPDLDVRIDDIRAVLDATGSGRAALFGTADGAALAIRFAATHPTRTRSLVLYGGYDRYLGTVLEPRRLAAAVESVEVSWGSGATLGQLAPSRAGDRRFVEWWARFERLSASPSAAVALAKMTAAIDVRADLARIEVPVLVVHRTDDAYIRLEAGRELARSFREARFVEVPGTDHPVWMGDIDRLVNEVSEFLTGERPVMTGERILAVLLAARLESDTSLALGERIERFYDTIPRMLDQFDGQAAWPDAGRMVVWFNGVARAVEAAVWLRDMAASFGLSLAQGIHAGEIDVPVLPPSGPTRDVAEGIAKAAYPAEILLSLVTSELVTGSGLQRIGHEPVKVDGMPTTVPVMAVVTERHLEPVIRRARGANLGVLSHREREVLGLIAEGLSNSMIALQLGLSEHTVKRHVANILLKLDLPTRTAAAALVARHPAM